jgi:hypothetical protein
MVDQITVFGRLTSEDQPRIRSDVRRAIPDAELHNGVARVRVQTYGDDPSDVFIEVTGADESACLDAYDRTFHAVKLILPWLWGGETPTVRAELTVNGEEAGRIDVPMDLVGWTRQPLHAASERFGTEAMTLRGMVLR